MFAVLFFSFDDGRGAGEKQVEHVLQFIVWWVGLGILSSVGLGTGIHSGVLFLYPHIMKVRQSRPAIGGHYFWSHSPESGYPDILTV